MNANLCASSNEVIFNWRLAFALLEMKAFYNLKQASWWPQMLFFVDNDILFANTLSWWRLRIRFRIKVQKIALRKSFVFLWRFNGTDKLSYVLVVRYSYLYPSAIQVKIHRLHYDHWFWYHCFNISVIVHFSNLKQVFRDWNTTRGG